MTSGDGDVHSTLVPRRYSKGDLWLQHPARLRPNLPSHGYVITKPVRGSDIPMDLTFVLTRDEIYVPVAVRKPQGNGPFPAITMGAGQRAGRHAARRGAGRAPRVAAGPDHRSAATSSRT